LETIQHVNPLGLIQREDVVALICSIGSFHQKTYKFPIAFILCVEIDDRDIKAPNLYNFEKIKNSYYSANIIHKKIPSVLLARKDSYFVIRNAQFSDDWLL
jgi:hypothetical protein